MLDSPYYQIPDPPEVISGALILVRMIDGLGFRFKWATENLRDEDFNFRPNSEIMSISELVEHIWGLVNWAKISIAGRGENKPKEITAVRQSVLDIFLELRQSLFSISEAELRNITIDNQTFWHIINGPLADALTHIGQINSFRRLAGNPTPKVNVFKGTPPRVGN